MENLDNGAAIVYKEGKIIPRDQKGNYDQEIKYGDLQTTSISNAENVWMNYLLCKPSMNRIYVIAEDKPLKDDFQRSQYVGFIELKSALRLEGVTIKRFIYFDHSIEFYFS